MLVVVCCVVVFVEWPTAARMLVARVTRALPPLLSPNVPLYKSNGILSGRGKVTESGGIPGNSGVISFLGEGVDDKFHFDDDRAVDDFDDTCFGKAVE